ncbi:MAG TPA: hypothetical protein ENH39_04450 [Gammaproteobacteria bacterium]|nr:hypothetical protein [Gammaproteobacteria bacterium]
MAIKECQLEVFSVSKKWAGDLVGRYGYGSISFILMVIIVDFVKWMHGYHLLPIQQHLNLSGIFTIGRSRFHDW